MADPTKPAPEPAPEPEPKRQSVKRLKTSLGFKAKTQCNSKHVAQARRRQVAILTGTGMSDREVGQALSPPISPRRVQQIKKHFIKPNKEGLKDLQEKAIAKHFPQTEEVTGRALAMIDKGLSIYDEWADDPKMAHLAPRLHDVVAAYHRLGERAYGGLYDKPEIR